MNKKLIRKRRKGRRTEGRSFDLTAGKGKKAGQESRFAGIEAAFNALPFCWSFSLALNQDELGFRDFGKLISARHQQCRK